MTDVATSHAKPISMTLVRRIKADRERVFDALTNPASLAVWWGPRGCSCPDPQVDLQVDGSYRLDIKVSDGSLRPLTGRYLEIDPPARLVFTWVWGTGEYAGIETTVAISLKQRGPQDTELTLTHSGFTSDDAAQNHETGWTSSLDCLAEIAEAG